MSSPQNTDSQVKQIFGEALCFELRGILIEKSGFDFRNRVAHGFVHEGECYSAAGVTVWWLVLRLCLMPMCHEVAGKENAEQSSTQGAASGEQSGQQPSGTQ